MIPGLVNIPAIRDAVGVATRTSVPPRVTAVTAPGDSTSATVVFSRPVTLLGTPGAGDFQIDGADPTGAAQSTATSIALEFAGTVGVDTTWTLVSGTWVSPAAVPGTGTVAAA